MCLVVFKEDKFLLDKYVGALEFWVKVRQTWRETRDIWRGCKLANTEEDVLEILSLFHLHGARQLLHVKWIKIALWKIQTSLKTRAVHYSCKSMYLIENVPEDMRIITFKAAYSTVSSLNLRKLSVKCIIRVMHWFPWASFSFNVSLSLILMLPAGIGMDR